MRDRIVAISALPITKRQEAGGEFLSLIHRSGGISAVLAGLPEMERSPVRGLWNLLEVHRQRRQGEPVEPLVQPSQRPRKGKAKAASTRGEATAQEGAPEPAKRRYRRKRSERPET